MNFTYKLLFVAEKQGETSNQMGSIQYYVLAARFMLTIGHLITILLVLSTLQSNVNASFGDNASEAQLDYALATSRVSGDSVDHLSHCISSFHRCRFASGSAHRGSAVHNGRSGRHVHGHVDVFNHGEWWCSVRFAVALYER